MRNTNEYPEYDGIREQFGQEHADKVGELIQQGHTGLMATINRISNMAGELSLVVLTNLLGLMSMENAILVRALKIMDPNGDRQDPIGPEEFGPALIKAQAELQAEAEARHAEESVLTDAEAAEQAEHPVPEKAD